MNNEFKKSKSNNETRYTLESMTAGATGSGSIATSAGSVGKVQKRGNILAQEAGKDKVDASKPRNFVAKNAKMGGAGAHKDKKKEQKQGAEKHKKPYMEALKQKIEDLKSKLNEAEGGRSMSRAAKGNEKYGKDGMKALAKAGREGASEKKLDAIRDKHDNYNEDSDPCWDSHKMVGTKKKGGKTVPNCVPKEGLAEDDSALQAFLSKGGKVQQLPYKKPRKADKTDYGSRHIGGGGDKMRASRTGTAAKTQGNKVAGMSEGASDFVGDSIEALRSSVPGLKQQDFLDELYMYIENQYGQRAAEMMANAGQDDFDEWYDSYLDNPEQGMAEVDTYMESLAESLQQVLSEKAVSKKQQRFMGMVHAAQKGEKPASKEVAKVAKDMGKKDAKDFAATKHKGLPEKKKSKK